MTEDSFSEGEVGWRLLYTLAAQRSGDATPEELASALDITPALAHRELRRLERSGYISRVHGEGFIISRLGAAIAKGKLPLNTA